MCQASVSAFIELWDFGLISSGATMAPCPWFLEAAAFCRENPQVDMGVHLTLTSEWESYRWGPISTRDPGSGMIDFEGCFYRTSEQAQEHGDPGAVQLELRAQVERAIALWFGWIASTYGYDSALEIQPETVATGFRVFMTVPVIVSSILAIIALLFYPLHGERLQAIKDTLTTKHASETIE